MINVALEWSVPILLFLCGLALILAAKLNAMTMKWGVGLCFLGVGYGLMLFRTKSFSAVKPLGEDLLLLTGVVICCEAFADRFKLRVSLFFDGMIILLALSAAAFSLLFFHSVRLESLSIIIGCAAVVFSYVWKVEFRSRTTPDLIILFSFTFVFACLLLQAIIYIFLDDGEPTVGLWSNSIWGILIQYTGLIGGVVLAFSVLLAINLDVLAAYRQRATTFSTSYTSVRLPEFASISTTSNDVQTLPYGSSNVQKSISAEYLTPGSAMILRNASDGEAVLSDITGFEDVIRDCLFRMTNSIGFARSPRARKFIIYIVEETLSGRAERIKECAIALDVFDRKIGDDLVGDSLVRTSAKRLRDTLDAYNNGIGKSEPIHITIPKGSYIPRFTRNVSMG
ncbi:hypothetical protein WKW50_20655 [Ochrobactrum sp. GPK 3]|uniref:hypothetical protein n=1 Tax=Brucella/Ochrobactrum group TaxID=2826938 RepID=UPI000993B89E|nr:vacuolar-type H+-ATPase subunit I/STV1 [Ochrobactrum sp. P6BSIII]OOL14603.1 hypothetical protein BRY73_23465 [Ochrobactrum sp. P6BS-III]